MLNAPYAQVIDDVTGGDYHEHLRFHYPDEIKPRGTGGSTVTPRDAGAADVGANPDAELGLGARQRAHFSEALNASPQGWESEW